MRRLVWCLALFFVGATSGEQSAWALVLDVPAPGCPEVTSPVLEAGQWYQIEVTGTYVLDRSNGRQADAEWSDFDGIPTTPWIENPNHPSYQDGNDLYINGAGIDWLGGDHFTPHTYSPNHTYGSSEKICNTASEEQAAD